VNYRIAAVVLRRKPTKMVTFTHGRISLKELTGTGGAVPIVVDFVKNPCPPIPKTSNSLRSLGSLASFSPKPTGTGSASKEL
jgi:hypothetical protein